MICRNFCVALCATLSLALCCGQQSVAQSVTQNDNWQNFLPADVDEMEPHYISDDDILETVEPATMEYEPPANLATIDVGSIERKPLQAACYGECDEMSVGGCYGGPSMQGGACEPFPHCGDSCGGFGCCDSCCGYGNSRTFVFGEFLYLHAKDADVAHAQQQNGTGGIGTVPFGQIGRLDLDYAPGVRIGMGIACDECSGIVGSYTWYEAETTDNLVPPTIGLGAGTLGSLVHHPQVVITSSAGPVDAEYSVNFQLADYVYRRVWQQGCSWMVNYSLGAQLGHLEQDFRQSGNWAGSQGGDVDTATAITLDGAGLKFGLDGEWQLRRGIHAYGNVSLAALAGRFRSNYEMLNQTTDVLLVRSNWRDDRVVSLLEYEVGLGWTSCNGKWRASGGYRFSEWGNAVTTADFIDAVQADNYTDVGSQISFSGITGRLECRW